MEGRLRSIVRQNIRRGQIGPTRCPADGASVVVDTAHYLAGMEPHCLHPASAVVVTTPEKDSLVATMRKGMNELRETGKPPHAASGVVLRDPVPIRRCSPDRGLLHHSCVRLK